jgi:thioredoxin 1
LAELADVTDGDFANQVLEPGTLALVDFWSDDCPPCRVIAPILAELATTYLGRVKVLGMNVLENPRTPARFGVRAMPTVLAFSSGEVVGQITGARPRAKFQELIDQLL